ncbi:MAG: hypothetical protein J0M11_18515 [Anaerolineae bacterium]|nr:hypothetical protein [Anaerolineae bacterium]
MQALEMKTEKTTRFGTISVILAVLVAVLWCVYFIIFASMTEGGLNFGMDAETAGYTVVLGGGFGMALVTLLLAFSGIVLGILGLVKKEAKRGLAIAGLAINFLCFAPYCLLLIVIALSGLPASS